MSTSIESTITGEALRAVVVENLVRTYGEHADLAAAIARGAITLDAGETLQSRVTFRRLPSPERDALIADLLYDGGSVLITRRSAS